MSKVIDFELRNPDCWLIFHTRDVRTDQQPTLFAVAETASDAFELILEMARITPKERAKHKLAYPMDVLELCELLGTIRVEQTFEAMTYEVYLKRADDVLGLIKDMAPVQPVLSNDNDKELVARQPWFKRPALVASVKAVNLALDVADPVRQISKVKQGIARSFRYAGLYLRTGTYKSRIHEEYLRTGRRTTIRHPVSRA